MDVKTPFEKGKAAFYAYVDLKKLESDTPFEGDPRFMVRPDVCGHCYQLNEILLDNPEPIILDKDHPRFDGPRMADGKPQFSIVIDSFDGEMIHAWHIETNYRKRVFKSANLAFQPRNNIDVLMGRERHHRRLPARVAHGTLRLAGILAHRRAFLIPNAGSTPGSPASSYRQVPS